VTSIQVYPTNEGIVKAAANIFIDLASTAISDRGSFSVVLSGGGTPQPLYEFLAADKSADFLEWSRIHFFWGDERTVPPDNPESNYRQAYQTLLGPRLIQPGNIHRIKGELDPVKAARIYQKEISDWTQTSPPSFDLVTLGMGGDGHTASLFPGTKVVSNPGDYQWVAANRIPQQDTWRITLTPQLINAARTVIFLVSGQNKAETLKRVLEGPFLPENYPAQLIKPCPGKLIWLVDQAAASNLET
jgi:6-phosphogluconolactonase